MRKISVIHPSRSRSYQAGKTYQQWVNNADRDFEYIASWDEDDCIPYYQVFYNLDHIITVCLRPNKSAIEAINEAAKIATGDILVVISDDFYCPPNWDTKLLKALEGKEDFCVKTDDGIQPVLMTLPIVDRIYYNRFGYIYHPDYLHMESDVEMTAVAHMLGRNLYVPLLFEHMHYSRGKSVKDAISIKNDSTYGQGKEVLNRRLKNNFGIEKPLCSFSSIKWH